MITGGPFGGAVLPTRKYYHSFVGGALKYSGGNEKAPRNNAVPFLGENQWQQYQAQ